MSYSGLRSPVLSAMLDGSLLPGLMEADISNNAHFGAARFRLRLAMDAHTASALFHPGLVLDVQVGVNGPPISLIQGEVDSFAIDVVDGSVSLEGRDLTARLLDARTQETFSNQTASEIAETLAARHGLASNVTATMTLAGRYYGNEHDRLTLGQFSRTTTEWDLLTFLAAREGFEVFITGQTLNFMPLSVDSTGYILTPQNCVSLTLEHALTLAGGVEVTVKSWNTRQQAAFTQTATSASASPANGQPRQIMVVRPNLSLNDAQQLAQRVLADLSAHERVVSAELPGECNLSPRYNVQLTGTGTDFDGSYYVADLDRHFSVERGFTETIRLKTAPSSAQFPASLSSAGSSE